MSDGCGTAAPALIRRQPMIKTIIADDVQFLGRPKQPGEAADKPSSDEDLPL